MKRIRRLLPFNTFACLIVVTSLFSFSKTGHAEEVRLNTQILLPPYFWWTYDHDVYGTNDDSLWFLGKNSSFDTPYFDDTIEGTDLGISVDFWGKTFFYMGDTNQYSKASTANCASYAVCNDAIVGLSIFENDASDGIDVFPYVDSNDKWIGQSIPGVHTNVFDSGYWNGGGAPFTVPTGAVVTGIIKSYGFMYYSVPTVMLWYATASNPATVDHSSPRKTPRSWVGCSTDGLQFESCYNSIVPFSEDTPSTPARFIQVAPVPVSYWDLIDMCGSGGYDTDNPLCLPEIYDEAFTVGGILIYGNGRHYRYSGTYVAYMRNDEIGHLNGMGRPIVHYLTKVDGQWTWSDEEADAKRILPVNSPALDACDTMASRNNCKLAIITASVLNPSLKESVSGEFSVKLIREGVASGDPPQLVMLSSGHELLSGSDNVRLRVTTLDQFWNWGAAQPTDGQGYGSYIVERFTEYDPTGDGALTLYFLTSKWGYGPYGVYSDSVTITPWPQ